MLGAVEPLSNLMGLMGSQTFPNRTGNLSVTPSPTSHALSSEVFGRFDYSGSASKRLDFLFLSLFSAFPTEGEKIAFLPEMKTFETTETFARAILTSNRFLFVQ